MPYFSSVRTPSLKIYKDVGPSAFNISSLSPHHQQHQFPSFSIFLIHLLPGSQSSLRLTRSSFNSITFVKDLSLQHTTTFSQPPPQQLPRCSPSSSSSLSQQPLSLPPTARSLSPLVTLVATELLSVSRVVLSPDLAPTRSLSPIPPSSRVMPPTLAAAPRV